MRKNRFFPNWKGIVHLLFGMVLGLLALCTPIGVKQALAADFTISGTVADESNLPIENIQVTVKRFLYYDNFERPVWLDVVSSTTSVSGEYVLGVPDAGPFRIEFADTVSPRRYHGEYFDDKTSLETSTEVVIAEGSSNVVANAQLTAIQPITGHVTDEVGNPLEQIQVSSRLLVGDPKLGPQSWVISTTTTSDASGAYTLTAPEATSFRIGLVDSSSLPQYQTEYFDNASTPWQANNIAFDKDHPIYVIDAQLASASVITGHVVDSMNNPVAQALIFAGIPVDNGSGQVTLQESRDTTSDNNGFYTLTLPFSGTVGVGLWDALNPSRFAMKYYDNVPLDQQPTPVSVTIGSITPDINFKVDYFGMIMGTVTDKDGNPIGGMPVSGHQMMTDAIGNVSWPYMTAFVVTQPDGRYQLPTPLPGVTHICFGLRINYSQPNHFIPKCYGSLTNDPAIGTAITVTSNQLVSGIDIQLARYAHVTGQVTDGNNQPLSNVSINSYSIISNTSEGNDIIFSELYTMTDGGGNYELWVVDQQNFGITANPLEPSPYTREYYENQVDPFQSRIFTYEGDLALNIDFQLSLKGNITGTVVNETGQALSGVSVAAYHYFWDGSGGKSWLPYATVTTNEQGTYTISQVVPDTYRIGFGLNQEYVPQFYPYTTTIESAGDIVLGLGESAGNIDGQLSPLQNTLSIQLNSMPKSIRNLHFTSTLGDFSLDDPALDDGDAYSQSISFTLPSAVYSFTLALPLDRYLQSVSCEGPNGPEVNETNFQITLAGGTTTNCAVQVTTGALIQTFSYHDANGDGLFNEGEAPQTGITITVHDVTAGIDWTQVSDASGLTEFANLPPNHFFATCQPPPSDWVNSQPGTSDAQYSAPCYSDTLQGGQLATIHFGNLEANDPDFTNTPATSPDGFVISDAPLVNDTDEEGEVQVNVYLPVVIR